jgi:hypothetical protein
VGDFEVDRTGEPKTEPKTSSAAPGHLRWDTSELQSHRCTVATVSMMREKIVLNFGAKLARDPRAGEVAVELLQRTALAPLTAKHLLAMLQRLIAEHDARSPPSAEPRTGL